MESAEYAVCFVACSISIKWDVDGLWSETYKYRRNRGEKKSTQQIIFTGSVSFQWARFACTNCILPYNWTLGLGHNNAHGYLCLFFIYKDPINVIKSRTILFSHIDPLILIYEYAVCALCFGSLERRKKSEREKKQCVVERKRNTEHRGLFGKLCRFDYVEIQQITEKVFRWKQQINYAQQKLHTKATTKTKWQNERNSDTNRQTRHSTIETNSFEMRWIII